MAQTTKQKQVRKVSVTVTVKVNKSIWKPFVGTLDEKSRQDFFNWIANDMIRHLMSENENPELLAEYLYRQNKRLGRNQEA